MLVTAEIGAKTFQEKSQESGHVIVTAKSGPKGTF